jgi:hypothetical protein
VSLRRRGSVACGRVLIERWVRAVRFVLLDVLLQYSRMVARSGDQEVAEALALLGSPAEGPRAAAELARVRAVHGLAFLLGDGVADAAFRRTRAPVAAPWARSGTRRVPHRSKVPRSTGG